MFVNLIITLIATCTWNFDIRTFWCLYIIAFLPMFIIGFFMIFGLQIVLKKILSVLYNMLICCFC